MNWLFLCTLAFIVDSVALLYLSRLLGCTVFGVFELFRLFEPSIILELPCLATSFLPPGFDPIDPGPLVPCFMPKDA